MALRILLLLTVLASGAVRTATLETDAEVRKFSDSVMTKVGEGDLAGAFSAMKPYVVIPSAEYDATALGSRSQREQFAARYGKSIGFEFVGEKKVGGSLLRLTYMERTEKHVLPWYFYFYKGQNGWTLNSFSWNDRMQDLF